MNLVLIVVWKLPAGQVDARVSIGMNGSGGFTLAVELDVHLPDLERSIAGQIVEEAHKVCPYSNATRGNVEVSLKLV